jgi:hypothetical protein
VPAIQLVKELSRETVYSDGLEMRQVAAWLVAIDFNAYCSGTMEKIVVACKTPESEKS